MKFSDEDIKTIIVNRLNWNSKVDASKVLVSVDKGNVTLTGEVNNYAERLEAFETARDVHGVRLVDNQTTVLYPPGNKVPSDEIIEDMVKMAFTWNPLMDEERIEVQVIDGIVTLRGSVKYYWQLQKADNIVSELSGIKDCRNELNVVRTDNIEDELIAKAIMDELGNKDIINLDDIKIVVSDGFVNIRGTVSSYSEEKSIFDVVSHTRGVTRIENNLTVEPFTEN